MKSEEKKRLLILLLIGVVVLGIIWFATRGNNKKTAESVTPAEQKTAQEVKDYNGALTEIKEDKVVNICPVFAKEREFESYKIANISLSKDSNNNTTFVADATNKSDKNLGDTEIEIQFVNKEGVTLGTIPALIVATKPGETVEIRTEVNQDYVEVYDFKIVKK